MDFPATKSDILIAKSELKHFILHSQVRVQLVSLKARRDKARAFCLNQTLQLEAELLDAQIKALEELVD